MDRLTVKPGYETLASVLDDALYQAQSGKGEERHANQLPFDQQPMQRLIQTYGVGFALGQAAKKGDESQGLQPGHDIAELLGAIVYLAGAVVALQRKYDAPRVETLSEEHQKTVENHAMLCCEKCGSCAHLTEDCPIGRPVVPHDPYPQFGQHNCLVCGQTGGHGGLPCPNTRPYSSVDTPL